jgi:ubiquinone/menaquinone biosynthesis C-methylase UbiE
MPTKENPGSARAQNKRLWSERAKFWVSSAEADVDVVDTYIKPFLDAVDLRDGHRLLDIAAGPGEPTLSASAIVGEQGHVVATDISLSMLEGIRTRGDAMNRHNFSLAAADMNELPFGDQRFDRVTCRMGIMFAADTGVTLKEIRRVLVPQGRAVFLFWGPDGETTMFSLLRQATAEILHADQSWTDNAVFRLGEPGTLAAAMETAGFVNIKENGQPIIREAPVGPAFWFNQLRMGYGSLIDSASDVTRAQVDARIRELLEPYRTGDVYRLSVHVRTAICEAPA